MKDWLSSFIQDTFNCSVCHFTNKHVLRRNQINKQFVTTDSSYTFQRSPQTTLPQTYQAHQQIKPDLIIDEDRNNLIQPIGNEKSPIRRPRVLDISRSTNTLGHHQYHSSLSGLNAVEVSTRNHPINNSVVVSLFTFSRYYFHFKKTIRTIL